MKLSEFVAPYEAFCPQALAVEGDPVGLQIGSLNQEVKKVLVTLDIREQTVREAVENNVDLIFAKHPVIFRPLSNLTDLDTQEHIVLDLARAGIAVYTSHTNIDAVTGGMNDWFCEMLGLTSVGVLDETEKVGRVGNTDLTSLSEFAEQVKTVFGLERLRLVTYDHTLTQKIQRVAICGGSGGKFWPQAQAKGADVYITGDIYYHTAHDLLSSGMSAIDPGHYIEHLFVPKVAEKLRSFHSGIEILESQAMTNPFYDF